MEVTKILSVGIDPAKQEHYGVAIVFPEVVLLKKQFANTYEGIDEFDREVAKLASERGLEIVYGLEDIGIYGKGMKEILLDRGRRIVEVNPIKSDRQNKSDEIAARSVAAVVLRSLPDLPVISREAGLQRTIREVSRERETAVKTNTKNLNRLHFHLTKVWLGSYKEFYSKLNGRGALTFFEKFSIPQDLQGVSVEELLTFLFNGTNKRGLKREQARAVKILAAAKRLKEREVSMEERHIRQMIKHLAVLIREGQAMIDDLELYLEELLSKSGQRLDTFPGVGTVTAAVLIGETGVVSRFRRARNSFALYNGTAPCESSSGKKKRWVANKRCNRRLKRTLYQIALTGSRSNALSREYYTRHLARGLSKREALKRLARRNSDILFAMMRDKTAYDPEKARQRIEERKKSKGKAAISHDPEKVVREIKSLALP